MGEQYTTYYVKNPYEDKMTDQIRLNGETGDAQVLDENGNPLVSNGAFQLQNLYVTPSRPYTLTQVRDGIYRNNYGKYFNDQNQQIYPLNKLGDQDSSWSYLDNNGNMYIPAFNQNEQTISNGDELVAKQESNLNAAQQWQADHPVATQAYNKLNPVHDYFIDILPGYGWGAGLNSAAHGEGWDKFHRGDAAGAIGLATTLPGVGQAFANPYTAYAFGVPYLTSELTESAANNQLSKYFTGDDALRNTLELATIFPFGKPGAWIKNRQNFQFDRNLGFIERGKLNDVFNLITDKSVGQHPVADIKYAYKNFMGVNNMHVYINDHNQATDWFVKNYAAKYGLNPKFVKRMLTEDFTYTDHESFIRDNNNNDNIFPNRVFESEQGTYVPNRLRRQYDATFETGDYEEHKRLALMLGIEPLDPRTFYIECNSKYQHSSPYVSSNDIDPITMYKTSNSQKPIGHTEGVDQYEMKAYDNMVNRSNYQARQRYYDRNSNSQDTQKRRRRRIGEMRD